MKRFTKILNRETTALLIIDIQEKILGVMLDSRQLVDSAIKLIKGAGILSIPVYYTEQYPKGLGPTVEPIRIELNNSEAVQKMSFSCLGAGSLFSDLKESGIKQVVVCGIESHVCVQQTVLDLIENGFQVNVAADAVSSRKQIDYDHALKRMQNHGAEISTSEAILFELLEVSGTDEFRAISKLIK